MRKRLFGVLAIGAIVVGACGPGATTAPSTPASAAPPASASAPAGSPSASASAVDLFNTKYAPKQGTAGGTVIFSDWQEANLFNPYYFNQVTEANVNTAVFDTLVSSTNDFKYAPSQATTIPTLDNGGVKAPGDGGDAMTVTWTLRDGLKWSDGQDLTCDDFKFTLGWIMDKANVGLPAGKTGYEDIKSIDCNGTTMVWHFSKLYEGYITLFGTGELPKHYMSGISIKDALTGKGWLAKDLPKAPVSGPFKFASITPGQELRLARNDNWKNKDGRSAYLDTIVFKWYKDADAMIAGFKGGEHDVDTDLNDADVPKIKDQGLTDQSLALDSLTYEFLRPNWSTDTCSPRVTDRGTGCPVSDAAIRTAIKWALDKNAINTQLLGGNAALAETNISPNAWFYVAPTETAKQDLDRANKALDDGGWTKGADGTRSKGGLKAKIEMCTTTRQVRQDTLALVSSWLKQVGIEAVVNPVSPDDIFASYNESTDQTPCALSRYKYDIAEHAFSVPLDPLSNYPVYHSSQLEPDGANDGHITDPAIDKDLETVKSNVDFAKVKDAMADFQKIYVDKTIEIPLYFRKEVYLVNPRVQNFTGNPTSAGPTWNAADWFVTGS
jgi:peptide/nickel transport system substrate-binding protein